MKKSTKDLLWIGAGIGVVLLYIKGKAVEAAAVASPATPSATSAANAAAAAAGASTSATEAAGTVPGTSTISGSSLGPAASDTDTGPITSPSQLSGYVRV